MSAVIKKNDNCSTCSQALQPKYLEMSQLVKQNKKCLTLKKKYNRARRPEELYRRINGTAGMFPKVTHTALHYKFAVAIEAADLFFFFSISSQNDSENVPPIMQTKSRDCSGGCVTNH